MARVANFSTATRTRIAKRAGYRCSFPGCNRVTLGPGDGPDGVEESGMAAHVFSASDDGPRGTGGLTVEQRSSVMNGIWLCYTHGKLIDSEQGRRYASFELLRWKSLQETRVDYEHRGFAPCAGGIASLRINRSPIFADGTRIEFGKVNLFTGSNGTGKSAVCKWINAAFRDPTDLLNWRLSSAEDQDLDFEVEYLCPNSEVCRATTSRGEVAIAIDGHFALSISHRMRVLVLPTHIENGGGGDDVDLLMRTFRTSRFQILQAIRHAVTLRLPFVSKLGLSQQKSRTEPDSRLLSLADSESTSNPLKLDVQFDGLQNRSSHGTLSSSEKMIVILSIAIALADMQSNHTPTLLVLDGSLPLFERHVFSAYVEHLSHERYRFQSILVSATERVDVDWRGWMVATFDGRPPDVAVSQSVIGAIGGAVSGVTK